DKNMLELTHTVADEYKQGKTIPEILAAHDIKEINVIDGNGIITESNYPEYLGFDMGSGEQSGEFLILLGDTEELVQDYRPIALNEEVSRKYAAVKLDTGFIQVGYDAESFQRDIDREVLNITKNRHVGKTGYALVMDASYNIVSAPSYISRENIEQEANGMKVTPTENETFVMEVNHEKSSCRFTRVEGYFIVSVLPYSEAMQSRNTAIYVNTFMEILVFAVLFAMVYFLIKAVVVNRIKTINNSLSRITDGDLGVVVDVRSNVEFSSLSDDINSTVSTLKCYIDEAAARIDKELELAKNIQTSAIPGTFPAYPKHRDFDIFALMNPAKEVGGDFYDFYLTKGDTMNFVIADVSGKGIPAAMFMMRAKTELKSLTEAELPLDAVFTDGNRALCEGNDAGMFVTAWQGSLDLLSGDLTFANAGHNPPLIRHADGKFEYLKTRPGFVLAGMDSVKYRTQQLKLTPGDTVFLYTDGVTEATNANNELYGEERLLTAINSREFETVRELCTFIRGEIDGFVGDAPQFDDITMVALRYFGQKETPTIRFEEAKLEDIGAVTEFAEQALEKYGCPMKVITQMSVAIDEIYSNIVRYGYKGTVGPITVTVHESEDPHAVSIRFRDNGVPYNPLTKADPDVTLSAEERQIGGLGIFMVKKMMDDVRYRYENGQNILTVKKLLEK
ncbi:MAG: SpoIIE family protein phosphatase, partial [Clostridia bacterium]|nr:SpoIIE family protein phosphatase [Clostridia bacterium]